MTVFPNISSIQFRLRLIIKHCNSGISGHCHSKMLCLWCRSNIALGVGLGVGIGLVVIIIVVCNFCACCPLYKYRMRKRNAPFVGKYIYHIPLL